MTCVNINTTLWTDNKVYNYVNIRNSVFIEATINIFTSVTQLYLSSNGLTKLCMISNINTNVIKVLDISENKINSLKKSCLRLPHRNDAKIAKICILWTFWLVMVYWLNHKAKCPEVAILASFL